MLIKLLNHFHRTRKKNRKLKKNKRQRDLIEPFLLRIRVQDQCQFLFEISTEVIDYEYEPKFQVNMKYFERQTQTHC